MTYQPKTIEQLLQEIEALKKSYRPSIIKAIDKAFLYKEKRNWDYVFYYFDIHETILHPDYNNTTTEFYEDAKDVLQFLSKRNDIVMALYTCSYPEEVARYQEFFKSHDINFVYINDNPEVKNSGYGCYDLKPYFNVLFEDKAGFDANVDWVYVKEYFKI